MLINLSPIRIAATFIFLLGITVGGVLTFAFLSGKTMATSAYVIAFLLTAFLYGSFSLFNSLIRRF